MQNSTLNLLKSRQEDILKLWLDKQSFSAGSFENFSDSNEENESREFIDTFIQSLAHSGSDDLNSPGFDKVNDVITGISISRGKRGYSPRETGVYLFTFKESIFEILNESLTNSDLLYTESQEISRILDNMTILTFEAFMKGREDVILRQTDEISEISTPVIKVWDGIVALPIIGTLDSARTQVVMENLLLQIMETESSIAILDISGVPAVDSLVAQHLIKTVSATRLMGAECIISGIRPEIAQTVVHLGIDLSNIITKATLASALQTAFLMLQLEVRKKGHNI